MPRKGGAIFYVVAPTADRGDVKTVGRVNTNMYVFILRGLGCTQKLSKTDVTSWVLQHQRCDS